MLTKKERGNRHKIKHPCESICSPFEGEGSGFKSRVIHMCVVHFLLLPLLFLPPFLSIYTKDLDELRINPFNPESTPNLSRS